MSLKKRLTNIFDDTKYDDNLETVRNANLSFYTLFNCVMIFLLAVLYLSTFVSDYARSMQFVYIVFGICSIIELFAIHRGGLKANSYTMPLCYFGVTKAYLFCLLTSVVYNQDAPAITFYVFLILIPVCFTFRIRTMMLIQFLAMAVFCVLTIILKDPELILSDTMNCMIFTLIGVIMSVLSTQMRLDNFDLYRRTDITERNNQAIFDTTPCGILKLTFSGMAVKVLFANKTAVAMFGYTEDAFWAVKDWNFASVVYPEDIPLVAASLMNPVVGHTETYDFRLKHAAQNVYHWVSCKFLIDQIEGEQITVLVTFLDVDEKKRTESVSEAKSRFLSRMSHEIRTPINAIMGMAELERQELAEENPKLDVIQGYADETTAASKYLLTLVNDILDTSRIENDKIELQNSVVNVDQYLRELISLIRPLADNKGVLFKCNRQSNLQAAYVCDPIRVQQILINIVNNAIKFTPEGGQVTLDICEKHVAEKKTKLEFRVSDTGIGMTKEFQKRLFQPFAQEDSGTTSPFTGTGLGLNIARALAHKMDGDIVCTSEQGKGTTFVVTIVVGNTEKRTEPAKHEQTTEKKKIWDFTGVRILLCEDHPMNQKITQALLMRNHSIVEIAENGAEGVKMVASHPSGYYSMILMDIRMPVMDGLQATEAIRQLEHPDAKTIPIVAMSANAFPEDIKKSLETGMNAHLAKPVDAQMLYSTVARFTNTEPEVQVDQKRLKILVVDDIEMNAAIIANMLKHDYEVLMASDGHAALEMLAHHEEIAAVITDIQMPGMDGIELIKKIRADIRYDQVAILANTQYDAKGRNEELLAIGADDFVYKAASPGVVVNRLRNVLSLYRDNGYKM